MDRDLFELSVRVGEVLRGRGWMLATAESCTGGWIGECITMVAGSSTWYDRGFITYSNEAKMQMLGVREATLRVHGAVSEHVVLEMARGTLTYSRAQVGVSVSGVAGPGGGTPDKPVGTVCIGWALADGQVRAGDFRFDGDRESVRRQSVVAALRGVIDLVGARTLA